MVEISRSKSEEQQEMWDYEINQSAGVIESTEEVDRSQKTGFQVIHVDEIKVSVIAKIEEMKELFEMDIDSVIMMAQHFNWN